MPQSLRDDTPTADEPIVIVEGRTAEEALEEVHRIHGTDARIVQAEKVRKGGVGGFFARELVQLTVETAPEPADGPDEVAEPLFGLQGTAPIAPPVTPTTPPAPTSAAPTHVQPLDESAPRRGTPVPPRRAVSTSRRGHAPAAASAPVPAPTPPVVSLPAVDDPTAIPVAAEEAAPASGIDAIVAGLAADTDRRESTFGDALRAALEERTVEPESVADAVPALRDRGNVFSPRPRDPLFASGATALAEVAERVDAPSEVLPSIEAPDIHAARDARRSREQVTEELEAAETKLDAAVRAATAGTTARTVLRAAETGEPTGFAPTPLAEPTAPAPAPAPAPEPALAPAAAASPITPARTDGAVTTERWSEDRLARLGVPAVIIRTIVGQRPKDDLAWLTAAARAVAPLVGPPPAGSALLVGRVRDHATALDLTVCSQSISPPHSGTVALAGQPTESVQRWLDRERGSRWLHLVVGGGRWRDWLFEQPSAVAWDRAEDLPDALGVAAQFDLPLTGTVVAGQWHAADPTDVAIALRTLLEQR